MIRGDGVGPELIHSAGLLLDAIGANTNISFNIKHVDAGDGAVSKFGKAMPDRALQTIRNSDACLKGPIGESAADVVLVLRQVMDLYANVRPVKSFPNLRGLSETIDLVIVRENTEDLYLGWEFEADDNTIITLKRTSEGASRRIAEYAFRTCGQRNKKKKVVAVHKGKVMGRNDGLFFRNFRKVLKKF